MPNPPSDPKRGTCQECTAYGGVYEREARFGATICLRPTDSGKSVCRMPEFGCCGWVKKQPEPKAE